MTKKKFNQSFISELNSDTISELAGLKLKRARLIQNYKKIEDEKTESCEKESVRNNRDEDIGTLLS